LTIYCPECGKKLAPGRGYEDTMRCINYHEYPVTYEKQGKVMVLQMTIRRETWKK